LIFRVKKTRRSRADLGARISSVVTMCRKISPRASRSLVQRGPDDFLVDAVDLQVELNAGDCRDGAGNFEDHGPPEVSLIAPPWMSVKSHEGGSALHQADGDAATRIADGYPASMSDSVPPQTLAMLLEPLDSRMSDTTRIV